MASNALNQLQLTQQNLQNIILQKQQIQNQILELESAIKQLVTSSSSYKIVGKIMISSSKEDLHKELVDKKEIAELRLKNFLQQENKLQENLENLQKEVMSELNKPAKKQK